MFTSTFMGCCGHSLHSNSETNYSMWPEILHQLYISHQLTGKCWFTERRMNVGNKPVSTIKIKHNFFPRFMRFSLDVEKKPFYVCLCVLEPCLQFRRWGSRWGRRGWRFIQMPVTLSLSFTLLLWWWRAPLSGDKAPRECLWLLFSSAFGNNIYVAIFIQIHEIPLSGSTTWNRLISIFN